MKKKIILILAILFLSGSALHSQLFDTTGRWTNLIYRGADSALGVFNHPPTSVFLRDAKTWFIRDSYQTDFFLNNEPAVGAYRTDDSGHSWRFEAGVHTPHKLFPDGVAISSDGFISHDSARTWQRLSPPFKAEPQIVPLKDTVRQAVAYSSNIIVCLYGPYIVHLRMCYSLDGAKTWQFPDSTHWDSTDGYHVLVQDSSIIGKFPSEVYEPSGNPYISTWGTLLGFQDSTQLYAITYPVYLRGDLSSGAASHYVAKVNLFQKTGELQWMDTVFENMHALYTLQWTTPQTGYLIQNDRYSFGQVFHRTADSGRTWQKMSPTVRSVRTSLRFFSENYGAGANGFTRDGGRTWQYWNHPWHDPESITELPLSIALDSARYIMLQARNKNTRNLDQVVKRSYDAGRTWTPSRPSPQAWSVAANQGRVVVGRGFRSLMLSTDYGQSWRDIGYEGGLPPQTSCVWSLGFPDTAHSPLRVVGLATMISYDNRRYVAMIESSDGGQTWREGMVFPDRMDSLIQKYIGTYAKAQSTASFVFEQGAEPTRTGFLYGYFGLYATTDGGATWQLRTPTEVRWLSMRDSLNGLVVNIGASGTLSRTTDGGLTWVKVPALVPGLYGGVQYLSNGMYRAVSIDGTPVSGGFLHFVHSSDDDGISWWTHRYYTPNQMVGGSAGTLFYWIDTNQVYKFDASFLTFSFNGAKTFEDGYWETGAAVRYMALDEGLCPAWAIHGGYCYVTGRADTVGRWRIDERPSSGVREGPFEGQSTGGRIWPNPSMTGFRITVGQGRILRRAELYNALGICVAREENIDGEQACFPVVDLPPGAYRVVLRFRDGGGMNLPVVVRR